MNYNETMNTGHIFGQIISVMFLATLVACNAPPGGNGSSKITQPAAVDQDWVIITQEQAEEMGLGAWLVESDNVWTPSKNDILLLEEKIAEYLSQNSSLFNHQPPDREQLAEYQRQFIGLKRNGSHLIYGNYFCNNLGINWRQKLVIVDDGGDCYFQVEYNVDDGMFTMLMVNGES